MIMSELQFTAFEESGKKNTEETLNLAKKNADALGIKKIVIASTTGFTIEKAIDVFDPEKYELICVTHNYGFKEGIEQEFPDDKLMEMRKKGVCFVTGTLAFSGVQSHLPKKFNCWDMSG